MARYKISANGVEMGVFEGADEGEAVEAYARDAGYGTYAELAGALGKTAADALAELRVAPALVSWRDVPLSDASEGRPADFDERIEAMREYREVGSICDWFLCTEEQFHATEDGDDLAAMGPKPEEIDWFGLDEAEG